MVRVEAYLYDRDVMDRTPADVPSDPPLLGEIGGTSPAVIYEC